MEQLLSEERKCEEKRGEEKILSAAELIHWEKQTKNIMENMWMQYRPG